MSDRKHSRSHAKETLEALAPLAPCIHAVRGRIVIDLTQLSTNLGLDEPQIKVIAISLQGLKVARNK